MDKLWWRYRAMEVATAAMLAVAVIYFAGNIQQRQRAGVSPQQRLRAGSRPGQQSDDHL